jgi:tetratricopeptide (TPR) repeat protein
MSLPAQTYHSTVYRNFRNIDATEFRRIVRFYERYEKDITQLDFEEYFELLVTYTHSLFEIGEYRKHLSKADKVISTSIIQNVTAIKGQEVYHTTLFRKAASHYNLQEYAQAKHILEELLKMNPYNALASRLLGRVLRDDKPRYIRHARAISIFLYLLSALVICLEVLIVKPFYEQYAFKVEILRNTIFFVGVLLLIGSELFHRWNTYQYVHRFQENVKKFKALKKLRNLTELSNLRDINCIEKEQ